MLIAGVADVPNDEASWLMRDPHVEALHYEIGTEEGISFGDPPDVTVTNHLGVFELSNGKLTIRPADHYANGEEAQAVLGPFLRAWELATDLTQNIGSIRFKFLNVHKIDRNPPPPAGTITGTAHISVGAAQVVAVGTLAMVHITQHRYPGPPRDFRTTPEVELAYNRWRAFRAGREPLQSMAYAVLTLVESVAGDRRKAATTLNVDAAVLSRIGELSSTRGDGATARKLAAGGQLRPLTGAESSWLEAAIRQIVRRLGEHAAGGPLAQLTMGDLPPL